MLEQAIEKLTKEIERLNKNLEAQSSKQLELNLQGSTEFTEEQTAKEVIEEVVEEQPVTVEFTRDDLRELCQTKVRANRANKAKILKILEVLGAKVVDDLNDPDFLKAYKQVESL